MSGYEKLVKMEAESKPSRDELSKKLHEKLKGRKNSRGTQKVMAAVTEGGSTRKTKRALARAGIDISALMPHGDPPQSETSQGSPPAESAPVAPPRMIAPLPDIDS